MIATGSDIDCIDTLNNNTQTIMGCEVCSSSTVSLKLAVLVLCLVFVLHIAGVALPRWSVLESDLNIDGLDSLGSIDADYHVGLWRDCRCTSFLGTSECSCVSKVSTTETFKAVQALETIGLIGLIIAGIISLIVLFTRQDKTLKAINIVLVFGSGVLIVIGVIVYAVECNDDDNHLFSYISSLLSSVNLNTNPARLSISFILCTIAGALCLLVCTTLLVYDQCTATPANRPEQQLHTMPVQYTNQGQRIAPAPGQVIIHNVSPQPSGYMPPPDYAQQYQPAAQFHPHGLPYKA